MRVGLSLCQSKRRPDLLPGLVRITKRRKGGGKAKETGHTERSSMLMGVIQADPLFEMDSGRSPLSEVGRGGPHRGMGPQQKHWILFFPGQAEHLFSHLLRSP